MIIIIFSAIYFILPAYIANMFPVFFGKLNLPGGSLISERLLGGHKTWRGFYAGYFGALLALYLQKLLFIKGIWLDVSLLNYGEINIWGYAFLFGIGALVGDAVKSFFKRRLNKKPGSPWFPFDQIDLVLGAVLFVYPFFPLPWIYIIILLVVTPILHFIANLIGYTLKLKEVWW